MRSPVSPLRISSGRNLSDTGLPPALEGTTRATLIGLGAATAWARVEGDKHHLSDVLVSAALGNFFARLSFGGMVRPMMPDEAPVSVTIVDDEIIMRLRLPLP